LGRKVGDPTLPPIINPGNCGIAGGTFDYRNERARRRNAPRLAAFCGRRFVAGSRVGSAVLAN